MPVGGRSGDTAEYSKREILQGGVICYSNRYRRIGMLVMLGIGAIVFTALWFFAPWQQAVLFSIFFIPVWTPFIIGHGWMTRTVTLRSENRSVEFRDKPMIGKPEVGSFAGEQVSAVSLVKGDKSWVVWVHRKNDKPHFIDSSEDKDEVEPLARELAEALGVPLKTEGTD